MPMVMMDQDSFSFLIERYGCRDEEPLLNFKRSGFYQKGGVETTNLHKISFVMMPNTTLFKMKEPWFFYVDMWSTVKEFEQKAVRAINIYLNDDLNIFTQCRIWKMHSEPQWQSIEQLDQALIDSGEDSVPINGILINSSYNAALKLHTILKMNSSQDKDVLVIETPKTDGKYTFVTQADFNINKKLEEKKVDSSLGNEATDRQRKKQERKKAAKKRAKAAAAAELAEPQDHPIEREDIEPGVV